MKAIRTMSRHMPRRGPLACSLGLAIGVAIGVALAACASSGPAVHLYTLMPADPPARAASAGPGSIPIVLEIHLPAQVDQPQWLVRLPDDSLMTLEQERWASPLRDEMRQALFEELGAKSGVVEARNAAATAPGRVTIDVRRFDSIPGREARIQGSWSFLPDAGHDATRCDFLYREPATGAVPVLAAAHRKAIVRLADAIGAGVAVPGRGQAQGCPASDPS